MGVLWGAGWTGALMHRLQSCGCFVTSGAEPQGEALTTSDWNVLPLQTVCRMSPRLQFSSSDEWIMNKVSLLHQTDPGLVCDFFSVFISFKCQYRFIKDGRLCINESLHWTAEKFCARLTVTRPWAGPWTRWRDHVVNWLAWDQSADIMMTQLKSQVFEMNSHTAHVNLTVSFCWNWLPLYIKESYSVEIFDSILSTSFIFTSL